MKNKLLFLFLIIFLEIALILFFPPATYFHQTKLTSLIYNFAQVLNSKVGLFPSFIIPFLQSQKLLSLYFYLPKTFPLFLYFAVFAFTKLKRFGVTQFFLSCSLMYIETAVNLNLHKINESLITPLFLIFLFIWQKKFKLPLKYYFLILFLAALLVSKSFWIQPLENLILNKLFLFFLPLELFESLPYLILGVGLILILKPILSGNLKKACIALIFVYLLVNLFLKSSTTDFKNARWVWADNDTLDQYLKFKKDLYLPKKLPASVNITAKSAYELYLNGQFVGRGPGPIDEKNRYFDQWNITDFTHAGINKVEIIAYNYNHETHFQKAQTGGVLADFSFKIGPLSLSLPTNNTWLVSEQTGWQKVDLQQEKIKNHEINAGLYREIYDFTAQTQKWKNTKDTKVKKGDNLTLRQIPYLSYTHFSPQNIFSANDLVSIDFGKVVAGYPQYTFKTSSPTTVKAQYFESQKSSMVQEDKFILPAPGAFTKSTFGRRGQRFINLTFDPPTEVSVSVDLLATNFPSAKIGQFESSDEILNQIYTLGEDTLKYAMQNQFEDSFVHERAQYLGDAYVDMLMGFYSLNPAPLAKKALLQYASTQKPTGLVETVYPSSLHQTILSYDLLFISFLKDYYLYTKDEDTLNKLLPTAEKISTAISKLRDKSSLIAQDTKAQLEFGDALTGWVNHRGDGDKPSDTNLVLSAFYAKTLDDLELLNKNIDPVKSQKYREQKEEFIKSIENYLTSQDLTTLEPHAAVAFLWSGTLNHNLTQAIYDKSLKAHRPTFVTGYFNLFYLIVMHQFQDTQSISQLLSSYWGAMLNLGARTTWETFDPRLNQIPLSSQTHAWSGTPTYFLPAYIAGIRPQTAGFDEILVEPALITSNVSAKVKVKCGEIEIVWQKETYSFVLDLNKTCPGNVIFHLPVANARKVTVNNKIIEVKYENSYLSFQSNESKIHAEIF